MFSETGKFNKFLLPVGIFLLAFFIIFPFENVEAQQAIPATFQKPANGTLSSDDWNYLLGYSTTTSLVYTGAIPNGAFVNTTLPALMYGPLGINTSPVGARLRIMGGAADTKLMSLLNNSGTELFTVLNPSGNVGVGTTNPATQLYINGTGIARNSTLSFSNNYDLINKAYADSLVSSAIATATSSITLWGGSTAGNIWSLNGANNVGIGTNAPTSKLHIASGGGISFAGNYKTYERSYSVSTATSSTLIDDTGAAFSVNKSYRVKATIPGTGTETGAVAVFRGNGTTFTLLKNFDAGISSNHIEFYLAGGIPSVRLYSHASLYGVSVLTEEVPNKGWAFGPEVNLYSNVSGNIGIGTSTPIDKLSVVGNISHTGNLISRGTNYASPWMSFIQDVNGNSLILGSGGLTALGAGESASQVSANVGAAIETLHLTSDGGIEFKTNLQSGWASRVDAMTILSAGNVGIGTTNPEAKLEVIGKLNIGDFTNNTVGNLQLKGDGADNGLTLWNETGAVTFRMWLDEANNTGFITRGVASTTGLALNSSGYVGIASSSPATQLVIAGTGIARNTTMSFSNAYDLVNKGYVDAFAPGGASSLWSGTKDGNIWNGTSGAGSVGIGTSSPTAVLHLFRNNATYAVNMADANNRAVLKLQASTAGTEQLTFSRGVGVMQLQGVGTDGATAYNIALNPFGGNVGIGINNPSGLLQVYSTASSTTGLYVSPTGLVGIGTVAPQNGFKLDVGGQAVIRGTTYISGGLIEFGSSAYQLSTSGNSWINGGNLGISTSTPPTQFYIAGTGIARNNTMTFGNNYDLINKGYVDSAISSGIAAATSTITLWGGSTTGNVWSLNGTNNIGIGTTTPANKLDVVGVINATAGFRVNNTAGAAGNYLRSNGTNFVASTIQASDIPTLNQNTTGAAYYITSRDTRAANDLPQDFGAVIKADFKQNSTNGLSDGGTYNGVMTWRKYGSTSDFSGGPAMQLAYTDNGNLWTRLSTGTSTWATWAQILNSNTGVKLQASTPGTMQTGHINISGTALFGGYVGIATTTPPTQLYINGTGIGRNSTMSFGNDYDLINKGYLDSAMSGSDAFWTGVAGGDIRNSNTGNVGIGAAATAGVKLNVGGSITATGMSLSGALTMTGSGAAANITGVNKLTAYTIDPLYHINGVNYSTYAPSMVGGVKEEYVGRIMIDKVKMVVKNHSEVKEYEAVVDFSKQKEGSDLWVWRKVVDFSKEHVNVSIVPYGDFASVYYLIEGDKLIFRSDKAIEVSYRLNANRFDWKKWPTIPVDQTERGWDIE